MMGLKGVFTRNFYFSSGTTTPVVLCFLIGLSPHCEAQTAGMQGSGQTSTEWRFEVASIRPADPSALLAALAAGKKPHAGTKLDGARLDMGSTNLMAMLCTAYSVDFSQVSGPSWLESQRFDVLASLPPGATEKQIPEMLRRLLEERFGLSAHLQPRTEKAYALVVGPKGPRLDPPISDEEFLKAPAPKADHGELGVKMGGVITGAPTGPKRLSLSNGLARVEYSRISLAQLAQSFGTFLGRRVVDGTGLNGTYHVILTLDQGALSAQPLVATATFSDSADGGPAIASDPSASVFREVEKLGLKLEQRSVSVDYLVIDHIEKHPTAN